MTEKSSDGKAAPKSRKASQDVDALVAEVAAAAKAKPAKSSKPAGPSQPAVAAKAVGGVEAKTTKTIRIRQVRSGICTPVDHKLTLKALGLNRIRQEVVRPDTP